MVRRAEFEPANGARLAGSAGFEPAASALTARRSAVELRANDCKPMIGGAGGSRTHDDILARDICSPLPVPLVDPRRIELPSPRCERGALPLSYEPRDWWTVRNSNSLPPRCHRGALPIELTARSVRLCCACPVKVRTLPDGAAFSAAAERAPYQGATRTLVPAAMTSCGHDRPYCRPVRSAHLVAESRTDARDGIRVSRSTAMGGYTMDHTAIGHLMDKEGRKAD